MKMPHDSRTKNKTSQADELSHSVVPSISDAEFQSLYGESGSASSQGVSSSAKSELADLTHQLKGWVNRPMPDESRERMRAALINAIPDRQASASVLSAPTANPPVSQTDLVPIGGTVWIRRLGARTPVPCTSVQHLTPNTAVEVAHGARAHIHYADGSLLLLAGETRLEVYPADTRRPAGSLSDDAPRAVLNSGRLFAWIAGQSSGRFAIRTPQGTVSVLGTEFDLEHRADQSLQIVVAGGKVRFRGEIPPDTLSGAEPLDFTLTSGQLLNVPRTAANADPKLTGVAPRTLTTRELRRYVAWSRGMDGSRSALTRGQGFLKAVGVVAIIAVLAFAFFYYRQDSSDAPPSASRSLATAPAATSSSPAGGSSATASPAAASANQPGEVLATAEVEIKKGNDWVPAETVQASRRLIEKLPDGSQIIETTLRGEKKNPAAGNNASAALDSSRFIGKAVRYTVAPDGQISSIHLPATGSAPDPGSAMMFLEMIRHTWMMTVPRDESALAPQPGQQWDRKASGSLPEFPTSSFTFTSSIRYDGPATDAQGHPRARFTYKGDGVISGLVFHEDNRNGRILRISLGEYRCDDAGTFETAVPNGGSMTGSLQERHSSTIAQTNIAGPGAQPFTRNMPPDVQERRIKITTDATR